MKGDASGISWFGRSERIRTSDPLLPKQVRYQAALRSAPRAVIGEWTHLCNHIKWRSPSVFSGFFNGGRRRL